MSTFEAIPRSDYYHMNTLVTEETSVALKSFRDFGGRSVTAAVNQVVSAHSWFQDCHNAGGLAIASSAENVEVLAMPPELEPTDPTRVQLELEVRREIAEYLLPRADVGTDNMDDLTAFWGSATSFYSNLVERKLHGATFHGIMPSTHPLQNTNTYTPLSPLDQALPRNRHGLAGLAKLFTWIRTDHRR